MAAVAVVVVVWPRVDKTNKGYILYYTLVVIVIATLLSISPPGQSELGALFPAPFDILNKLWEPSVGAKSGLALM